MQAPNPLQQDVCGREVRNQEIGTDVEALLQSLRPDQDQPLLASVRLHLTFDFAVQQFAILACKATVMQGWHTVVAKQRRIVGREIEQRRGRCNGGAVQITHDQNLCTAPRRLEGEARDMRGVANLRVEVQPNCFCPPTAIVLLRRWIC